ncbi:hypothetical protein [Cellulomonas oligotrophica]|uniref:Uncharacterized protein n=1 Tax=Cellulomonas oligotrophica TaxID=931536 RepID=A0A7Y9FFC7_9CELL|nr:hypothetical protein [Cellulomonas oligotrophica]NYD85977.1 hypothetical protein [Cellulomonas oligotrophica]
MRGGTGGVRGVLRAVLLVVALVLAPAGAAVAAPAPGGRFVCEDGTRVARQQIYADVLVPAGATCRLTKVAVHGDLLVDPGGSAEVRQSSVLGDVLTSGYAFFAWSTVEGDVWLDGWAQTDPVHAALDAHVSTVRGDVRGRGSLTFLEAEVDGAVNVTTTSRTLVTGSRIGGWVNLPVLRNATVDVSWSDLGRGLTFSERGTSSVCGTTVAEDLVVRSVGGRLHVGTAPHAENSCFGYFEPPPGHPLEGLDPPEGHVVTVGGDLRVVDAGRLVAVDQVVVGGDLRCEDDVRVGVVDVAGVRTGTCA